MKDADITLANVKDRQITALALDPELRKLLALDDDDGDNEAPSMLDAALDLATRYRFAVFPCKSSDKAPLTTHGFLDASTGLEQIAQWWTDFPNAMIGVATGTMSGFWALDVDDKDGKEGSKRLVELEEAHGQLPRTVSQRTPSGGKHYLFRMPADGSGVQSRTNINGLRGIDTRGGGGYIVIAPSVMSDGNAYSFMVPLNEKMADAPGWLLGLVGRSSEPMGSLLGKKRLLPIGDPHFIAKDKEWAVSALNSIDPDTIDYDKRLWVQCAYTASVGADEACYPSLLDWCRKCKAWNDDKEEFIRGRWDHFRRDGTDLGWPHLCNYALEAGWSHPEPSADIIELRIHGRYLKDIPIIAEKLLSATADNIYCYGEKLVHSEIVDISASDKRVVRGLRLVPMKANYLRTMLSEKICFLKYEARAKKAERWAETNCPKDIAESILDKGVWDFSSIRGFTNCPVFLRDGSILTKPGYHAPSQIYFIDEGLNYTNDELAKLTNPSRDDACGARDRIAALIEKMPYKGATDRAGALALVLSSLARYAVKVTPMFGVTATGSRQGKSKHADLAAVFAEGHAAAATPPGSMENELEKQIATCLRYGDGVISLDNVVEPIGDGALINSCLTQETVNIRLFGKLAREVVPGNRLIIANGNNLVIEGDTVNRAILIQLDCPMEHPEEREFNWDPVERAIKDRRRYILDILTILRAYHLAGRPTPTKLTPMGGFEEWSALVRGALVWLGEKDPRDNMDELRKNDPEREGIAGVIAAWWDEFKFEPISAKTILEGKGDVQERPLRTIIESAMNDDRPTALKLNKWLQKAEGKTSGSYRIKRAGNDTHAKIALWKIEIPDLRV